MTTIQFRRGTAQEWAAANPVLAVGEPGYEVDSGLYKIGDGVRPWTSLTPTASPASLPPIGEVAVFHVALSGSDRADGRTESTPFQTLNRALEAAADNSEVADIRLWRGPIPVEQTAVIPQAVRLSGYGPLISQQSELVWTGPDDGSYVLRTGGDRAGCDFTWGELGGFLIRPAKSKPGGGSYSHVNGLHARNFQNAARLHDVVIQDLPGTGLRADWANGAVPPGAFPGWCTFERVWSTGNRVNWHILGGFTSVLYSMCAGDVSSRTTDVFLLDPPTAGTMGGKAGNHVFIGFKSEDNGTPTGPGADPNYFTINSDAGVSLTGSSAKRGAAGTKPWINYTATPSSANAEPRQIPLTLVNCHTSNIPSLVRGPEGNDLLKPIAFMGGQVQHVDVWSTKLFPNQKRLVIDDNFVRPNSTSSLGATERGGKAWVTSGPWGISNNQAYPLSSVNSVALVESGLFDCSVEATFAAIGGNAQRLIFRATDFNNYLFLNPGGGIWKRQAGVESNIGATPGIEFSAGDVARVAMVGSKIWIYKNGQMARVPLTETFNSRATRHGLGSNSGTATRFDDFSVSTV